MYLLIANCVAAVILTTLTYNKFIKLKRPQSTKKVVFACSASGCCNDTDFSTVDQCTNRYCFKKNLWEIVARIEKSQRSICLALYSLSLRDVEKALLNAHRRGVRIKIITTGGAMRNLSGNLPRLSTSGVTIRFPHDNERLLHHKFCIVDGEKSNQQQSIPDDAVLLTGSMNWTINSFTSNWDNFIVTSDKELIEKYQIEFDSLWHEFRRSQQK